MDVHLPKSPLLAVYNDQMCALAEFQKLNLPDRRTEDHMPYTIATQKEEPPFQLAAGLVVLLRNV